MIFRNTSISSAGNAAAICLPMVRITSVSSAAATIATAVGRFLISFTAAAAAVVRMLLVLFAATASAAAAAAAAALWGLVFVVALP